MNKAQGFVIVLAVALLSITFLFPVTSYPTVERSTDGLTFRSTVKTGVMPLWRVEQESEKAPVSGNPFSDTMILWHWVAMIAVAIVILSAVSYRRLQSATPAPAESPSTRPEWEPTDLKWKVVSALGHGVAVAVIYLGVKHFARGGLENRDLWVTLILAAFVALLTSLPWRMGRSVAEKEGG